MAKFSNFGIKFYSLRHELLTRQKLLRKTMNKHLCQLAVYLPRFAFDELAFDEALEVALEARLDGTGVANAASK